MSKEEENIALVKRFLSDILEDGKLDHPSDYLASDFVAHDPYHPQGKRGVQEYLDDMMKNAYKAYTDVKYSFEDVIASGEKVVIHYIFQGKQTGNLGGLPPTGKEGTLQGVVLCRVANGKIAELRVIADSVDLLEKLGHIPQLFGVREAVGLKNALQSAIPALAQAKNIPGLGF